MKRREFLKNSVFIPALGITLVYSLSGCSDDTTSSDTTTLGTQPEGTCTTVSPVIGANHLHTITPPTAPQVAAFADITLNLTVGNFGDIHTVTLRGDHLRAISTCGVVTVRTTTNAGTSIGAHSHSVTFTGNI